MILYILDINYLNKQSKYYLYGSIFCLVFGIIYECNSHNVYSPFMMFAFLIPLVLGYFISFVMYKLNNRCNISYISNSLYNLSIITFTIASIFKGVLDIYGTTNSKIMIYLLLGLLLFI